MKTKKRKTIGWEKLRKQGSKSLVQPLDSFLYFGILFQIQFKHLQNTDFSKHIIWHHFEVDESNWVSLSTSFSLLCFALHLLLLIFPNSSLKLVLVELMGPSMEELMAWQPKPVWQDLNHWPSFITLTFEKFQLKIFCLYQGLNLGLLPYHVFDAYTVNQHSCRNQRLVALDGT